MVEEEPKSLDVIYLEVKSRLDQQFEQIESLNQRAQVLFGFVTVIMSLLVGFMTSVRLVVPPGLRVVPILLILIAVALYVHVVGFLFWAYKVETYRRDPEPGPLRDNYLTKEPDFTQRRVMSNFIESYEANKTTISKKVRALKIAFALFVAEAIYVVMIGVAVVIYKMYT